MSDTPTYDALAHLLLDAHAAETAIRPEAHPIVTGSGSATADVRTYGRHRK